MATVYDIAADIRTRLGGRVSRARLLKLAYYVQAWSMADRGRPAYPERTEAWRDGPVARDLWTDLQHYGGQRVDSAKPLDADDAALVERVLIMYGNMSEDDLVNLTHDEAPWLEARGDLHPSAPSQNEVSIETMRAYYAQRRRDANELDDARCAPRVFSGTMDDLDQLLA